MGVKSIDDRIRSIVNGTLLGDGYVYPNGTLQIDHSVKQTAYVEWKFEQLQAVVGKPPRRVERTDKRTGKRSDSLRFYTRSVFREERLLFHPHGAKGVPVNVVELLDPLALAVWYMDDGGRGGRTPLGMVWNVAPFQVVDRKRLQRALDERYGIQTTLQKAGQGTHLYIRAQSAERFVAVVSPHIIPTMRYKLPLDPVTTEALCRGGVSSSKSTNAAIRRPSRSSREVME